MAECNRNTAELIAAYGSYYFRRRLKKNFPGTLRAEYTSDNLFHFNRRTACVAYIHDYSSVLPTALVSGFVSLTAAITGLFFANSGEYAPPATFRPHVLQPQIPFEIRLSAFFAQLGHSCRILRVFSTSRDLTLIRRPYRTPNRPVLFTFFVAILKTPS